MGIENDDVQEDSHSRLMQEFVEVPRPLASDIDGQMSYFDITAITFTFSGISTGKSETTDENESDGSEMESGSDGSDGDQDDDDESASESEPANNLQEGLMWSRISDVLTEEIANLRSPTNTKAAELMVNVCKRAKMKMIENAEEAPGAVLLECILPLLVYSWRLPNDDVYRYGNERVVPFGAMIRNFNVIRTIEQLTVKPGTYWASMMEKMFIKSPRKGMEHSRTYYDAYRGSSGTFDDNGTRDR